MDGPILLIAALLFAAFALGVITAVVLLVRGLISLFL